MGTFRGGAQVVSRKLRNHEKYLRINVGTRRQMSPLVTRQYPATETKLCCSDFGTRFHLVLARDCVQVFLTTTESIRQRFNNIRVAFSGRSPSGRGSASLDNRYRRKVIVRPARQRFFPFRISAWFPA